MAEALRDIEFHVFFVLQPIATVCELFVTALASGRRQQPFATDCNNVHPKTRLPGNQKCLVEHKGLSDTALGVFSYLVDVRSVGCVRRPQNRLPFRPTLLFFFKKVCPEVPPPFPFKVRSQNATANGQIERPCRRTASIDGKGPGIC